MPVVAKRTPGTTDLHPAPHDNPGAPRTSFDADASRVLHELQLALAALLAAAPSAPASCAEVEHALGIDAMLAWQVLRIARATDTFAAGIKVPSRTSIAKLLKSAARRRIPLDVTDRVSQAFNEFERLVADHAGGRAEFEMMVSAYSPEAREKAVLAAKQAAFKGMSQVKGVTAEADFTTMFWIPSEDPLRVDTALIEGHIGIRRVWPGAPIMFSDATFGNSSTLQTLDGRPIESGREALVQSFCSSPLPAFKQHAAGRITYHSVAGQDVGLRSSIDLVRSTIRKGGKSRFQQRPGHYAGAIEVLEFPAKQLTLDLFLHQDIFPGVTPELAMYDTGSEGVVTQFNDPAREHDRLQLHENIRPLGRGFAQTKLPHIPRYLEMLQHVTETLRLDPAEFRGFRLDVQYPVYGAEYMVAFRLPEGP